VRKKRKKDMMKEIRIVPFHLIPHTTVPIYMFAIIQRKVVPEE
jgi:hypothetical protein